MQRHFSSMVIAMMQRDTDGAVRAMLRMEMVPEDVDNGTFWLDVHELNDKYYQITFRKSVSATPSMICSNWPLNTIQNTPDLTLLGKTIFWSENR